jgi:ABC-type transporter Mla subunit MlaD
MSEARVHTDPTIARTARRELWLGAGVLAVLAVVAWLSTVSIGGNPLASHYQVRVALADEGPILKPGADVRVGGRRVGVVRSVDVGRDGRTGEARVELSDGRVGPGASARVRLRGLAGVVYLELQRGDTARPLASGTLISPRRAGAGVQLTDVVAAFDHDARAALARSLDRYGHGVRGRGVELNRTLARLPGTVVHLTPLVQSLRPAPGALTDVVGSADRVAAALAPTTSAGRVPALAALLPAARTVLATTGARATDLSASLRTVPAVEAEAARTLPGAHRLLSSVAAAARELRPGIAALDEALPALRVVEARAAGVDELGRVGRAAAPVVRLLTPVAAQLRGAVGALAPIADPLAVFSRALAPYRREILEAPAGFTRWGNFTYAAGQGAGHRAVRFSMILTCANARNPYPAPDTASKDRKPCP